MVLVGVEEVTIVVGYRKDAIQYACGSHFGELKIKYIESTVFDRTGSALPMNREPRTFTSVRVVDVIVLNEAGMIA